MEWYFNPPISPNIKCSYKAIFWAWNKWTNGIEVSKWNSVKSFHCQNSFAAAIWVHFWSCCLSSEPHCFQISPEGCYVFSLLTEVYFFKHGVANVFNNSHLLNKGNYKKKLPIKFAPFVPNRRKKIDCGEAFFEVETFRTSDARLKSGFRNSKIRATMYTKFISATKTSSIPGFKTFITTSSWEPLSLAPCTYMLCTIILVTQKVWLDKKKTYKRSS